MQENLINKNIEIELNNLLNFNKKNELKFYETEDNFYKIIKDYEYAICNYKNKNKNLEYE